MKNLYIKRVNEKNLLKANIKALRKQYLGILARLKQRKGKKVHKKVYFKELA